MADYWINWRFGKFHLKIGRWYVTFEENPYWSKHEYDKWFQKY